LCDVGESRLLEKERKFDVKSLKCEGGRRFLAYILQRAQTLNGTITPLALK
jgi:hypothetical protein